MNRLFTVLLAEKEHIDAIQQENKLFFEPFLENKELALCYWNPTGQTLADSAPGLLDIVGRRKNWRIVILNNPTADSIKSQNPFDVVDASAIKNLVVPSAQPDLNENWDEWEERWKVYYEGLLKAKETVYKSALELPLQKMSTWLCFRPEDYILNDVEEKQDEYDWALKAIGTNEVKPSVRLERLEKSQYKSELRLKEELRRVFMAENHLNVSYPIEINCISIRTADNGFFNPDTYWNSRRESEYSSFADRNMYFDKMRFMTFDLLPKTHRNFRTDYIRFLATVLIFSSNNLPTSALQARRLYQLETETDDSPLCTLVTSYDRKLAATFEVIEAEMERIRSEIPGELTDKDAEALFCRSKDIPVVLDESCDTQRTFVEKDYGLFFDSPTDELDKWNSEYSASRKALVYIAKQQSRSVKKSVVQAHLTGEISDINISRLTPLQLDDVSDYTDAAENEMIANIPSSFTDTSVYTKRMEEESEKVKEVLRQRMQQKTVVILGGICLGLFFACFLPFLLSNTGTVKTRSTAIVLIGLVVAALVGVMVASLFYLRTKLLTAVKSYNNTIKEIMNDIELSMKCFSKYLSSLRNVRRGHAIQNHAEKTVDVYTKSLRIRKKHLEDIRKKRAYLAEEYTDYFGDKSYCDETMSRPYEYDFDQRVEYTYPAPFLAGDSRQIEFISNGNFITSPTSYVTRILVRMEELYDK